MFEATLSRPNRKTAKTKSSAAGLPSAFALLALLTLPTLSPAALAYPVTDTTFAAGVTNATLTFAPGNAIVAGPSVHLLTNATFVEASLDIEGASLRANGTATRSSSSQFNAGLERTHVSVFMGTLSMNSTSAVVTLDAGNNFGNGTFSNLGVVGGRIVLNGSLTGTYTTPVLNSNGAPWGFVFIDGSAVDPSTATLTLLDPNDAVVGTGFQNGQRIPFSLTEVPFMKFQLVLNASGGGAAPEVRAFGFGARAADYNIGTGVRHALIGTQQVGEQIRTLPNAATLSRDPANPVVNTSAATYYSQYLSQPFVVSMNGSYAMYLAAGTNVGPDGASIARATSSALSNWTLDSAALLSPTAASPDQYALTHPYVFEDPEGSGYIMLYTAWSAPLNAQIARATSSDGVNWTKTGVVLPPAVSGWDTFSVGMPALVQYNAGTDTYTLYYSGTNVSTGGGFELGRATSNDGITWTRDAANPLMGRTAAGPDQDDAQGGHITGWANTLYYYYGCDNAGYGTCLAISANGSAWAKIGRVLNTTALAFDSDSAAFPHAVIAQNGTLHVFYAGFDATHSRIGRTSAPFGAAEYSGIFQVLAAPYPDWITFTKSGSNPVIGVAPSTYYSAFLADPHVVEFGPSEWWMYLSANTVRDNAGASIARATSSDLAAWTMDAQPLLSPTAGTYDAGGLIHPYVVENPWAPGWFMYYTALSATGSPSIALATSEDAVNWTKVGAVFSGSGAGWDQVQAFDPAYFKYNASADRLRMWYAGRDAGGQVSTGIASSPNGVNWTRITNNPVLPHGGAGSVDRDVAQGGKIIDMQGTLAFYYTCIPGTGAVNSCLATSVDGGFSFAKQGLVLNASGSGFDALYAAGPAPVLAADKFLLFYGGFNPTTAEIGVAVGAFNPGIPGAWAGRPQELPRFISGFSASATPGAGASASYSIRSSNDGTAWSNFEGVSASDTSVFTAPRRFIQYRVQFSAGTGVSVFDSALVNFSTYYEFGRWRSDHIMLPAPIDRFRINATFSGAGHIDWYAEIDDIGTVAAIPNHWAPTPGGGQGVVLRADLFGSAGEAPQLYSVTIRVESDGLPEDVAVRVGPFGAPRFASTGPLSGKTRVTIPGSDFTAAVNSYLTLNPNGISTDVLLNFTSTHFGVIKVTNLTLNYTLRNPITAVYSPAAPAFSINESETATFSVAATTCCGAAITYAWFVDGVARVPPGVPTNLQWTPTFDEQGTHTIALQMENGETVVTRVWTITVINVNRPPAILGAFPPQDPSISYKGSAFFSVEAEDPDRDSISFEWLVDGLAWDATSNETSISGLTAGTHTVSVVVWDAWINTTKTWTLSMTDSPPTATYSPLSPATVSHLGTITFTVSASDPDGDMVTYRWTVGSTPRPETGPAISVAAPTIGNFTVRVVATGGSSSTTHDWFVTSTDSHPTAPYFPADQITVSHGSTVSFFANGTDPDGDEVSYQWLVDGVAVEAALGPGFALEKPAVGTHNVVVNMIAGFLTTTHRWTITATNAVPVITGTTPTGGSGLATAAAQSFAVTATDADGDALTYTWRMNGNPRNEHTATLNVAAGLPAGQYTLEVTVADGSGGTAATTWTFTVPQGSTGGGAGGGLEFILLGVAVAGGVGAFLVMRMRKKGRPPADAPAGPQAPEEPAPPAAEIEFR